MHLNPILVFLLFLGILLVSLFASLSLGGVSVPLTDVLGILAGSLLSGEIDPAISRGHQAIVWELRFPRSLLAAIVGSGLAVVGVSLQSLTRNYLADPHLLGISAGGAFGAILALLHVGFIFGQITVPLFAFLGAVMATGLVLWLSIVTSSFSASRLVLIGVAVSFVVMAFSNVLIFLGDSRATQTVVFWMLGGFGTATWNIIPITLIALLTCFGYFILNSGTLNAMTMGDETASTMGIPVFRFRLIAFVVGAFLTGVLVSYSGVIGFVGLMVPHIARFLVGGNNFRVLPISAMIGAVFLLLCDVLARTLFAPQELPVGIVTGLIGGGFFIWLLANRKG